ncbi:NRPS [Bacidia gigantensis]|uniref:NRPS n=1 Tax=Bacidia gigantensis TaxID=2732470 RepID=UPI001D04ADD0|nr:NRPS [Bacidia gigantensis]KAG8530149.1 NRPS [Bacidia gigantensis]
MAVLNDGEASCSSPSAHGAVPCKLPLLDGEPSSSGHTITAKVELKQAARIWEARRRDADSLHEKLCTSWALLLRCFTGQDQIHFHLNERHYTDTQTCIQLAFAGDETLRECAAKTGETVGILEQKQESAGISAMTAASPASVSQLVNTAVCIYGGGTGRLGAKTNQEDLKVSSRLKESGDRLSRWSNESNRISRCVSVGYLESLASTFGLILETMQLSPNVQLKDLEYLSEHNKRQIHGWNDVKFEPVDRCINDFVHEKVLANPQHEAVCAWDGSLTYRNLWRYVQTLAQSLVAQGVGPEVIVPLCFEKSVWATVAMLAVMEAGGGFCPLDPLQPQDRLRSLAQRLGAKTLLCSRKYAGTMSSVAEKVVSIDQETFDKLPVSSSQRLHRSKPSNTAYVLWTSGSTGEPKGVVIEQKAYCSSANAHGPGMFTDSHTRVLQYASYVFDASLHENLTTLMLGGTICVPSEHQKLNGLPEFINEMRVNWALLTPSVVNFLHPSTVPGLKTLLLVGEVMSREHMNTWSGIRLMNGYGPAECAVASTVNTNVPLHGEATLVGHGLKVKTWLVDPDDHNRLVPPGCIGELLVEGPTLARGYLNDPVRTRDAFIEDPAWAQLKGGKRTVRRMYKTGDLARYHTKNHMLFFVGRKDTQVKHHGQRIELGEIEHHLCACESVERGIVVMPKNGLCSQRLVAAVSLHEGILGASSEENDHLHLVDNKGQEKSQVIIEQARKQLSGLLPAFMMPSIWLVFNSIPLLKSGKLDRKMVSNYIQDISDTDYSRWVQSGKPVKEEKAATELEEQLRLIWSHVLNLQPNMIGLSQSFMSLGGDSITAMTVQSQCKKRNLGISVQEIIRAKSIRQLAGSAQAVGQQTQFDEKLDEDFSLSPIQSLYFELPREKGHFNQSFFLRVTRPVEPALMHQVTKTIVNRHSMLRARFRPVSKGLEWKQKITSDVTGSYAFKHHECNTKDDTVPAMSRSQASLNPEKGPLFAVDLFDVKDGTQLLFMTAHHLVIDLVSWRVIMEEVEELLTNPTAGSAADPSISFQAWCKLQFDNAQEVPVSKVLQTDEIPAQSFSYWGINEAQNTYGNVSCQGFEVDTATTAVIVAGCHDPLRTEPLDVLLAAMIYSFSKTFTDRPSPAIFNEGHGREVWDNSIDLSRTAGWFTTLYPVFVATAGSEEFIDVLRQVKDYRRSVPGNGRPYFASRQLTRQGARRFRDHWPLEFTFNYLGTYQQLEREGALLVPAEEMAGEARAAGGKADYGHDTLRFGLFETSAVVVQGKLRFSFTFNKNGKHLEKVGAWITECEKVLCTMPSKIAQMVYQPTLSDYPLLSLNYDTLRKLTLEKLPSLGIDIGNVDDIYPCSQVQQGLLISMKRDAGHYAIAATYAVKPRAGERTNAGAVAAAWQTVVDRHPSLRTIFIESSSGGEALYDQVVLKNLKADIPRLTCDDDADAGQMLESQGVMEQNNTVPAHKFTILETSEGRVFCQLEISHAIVDGQSLSTIFKELVSAYEGRISSETGPLYRDYIAFLQDSSPEDSISHWESYLTGLEPCSFPILNDAVSSERVLRTQHINFDKMEILGDFCKTHSVTLANVFHMAWAMTLQCYTGSQDVCFGYLNSTRDSAVQGIDDLVGYLVNMLVCRVKFDTETPLITVLQQIQKDLSDSQDHRQTALSEVLHALKISGDSLFNTSLSYRRLPPAVAPENRDISFVELAPYYDPTEYNVSINIEVGDEKADITLDYWTDVMSDGNATFVANNFLHAIQNIIEHSETKTRQLNTVSDFDHRQFLSWNENMPPTINRCIHDVVSDQVALYPDKEAVRGWDAAFTYAELDALAGKLASHLSHLGVGPESFVCLCFEKSAYTVVAQLAVLKAGGAFVSLDPMHPKAAFELRISDTQARVIMCSPCYKTLFDSMEQHIIAVDQPYLNDLKHLQTIGRNPVQPHNPAYVIYTSGSTGKPKGVVVEHRAFATSAKAHGDAVGFDNNFRSLQFASYTFDNSLEEVFTTLQRGGTVCVPSEHDRMNDLAGAVSRLDVNFMDLTPTVAMYLKPLEMTRVKKMVLGGEAMTRAVLEVWGDHIEIHNMYGPSECSVNSTHRTNIQKDSDPSSIGHAIGSVSWVVEPDNHDRLVPLGCAGELLLEGPILARGYLNDKEKTDKAFIENPAWTVDQGQTPGRRRMYKTGDLVRYNSDGSLAFIGRKDQQIKFHGLRIELGEIEYHIRSKLPADWQFGVELVTPGGGQKALALFVCPQFNETATATAGENGLLPISGSLQTTFNELNAALVESLAKHMIPSVYVPLHKLPLMASGKLDRKHLRATAQNFNESQCAMYRLASSSGQMPSTKLEKTLAGLWETVLKFEAGTIGMNSQFFRMGGDSISAIRLVTAARDQGINLTVANIFRNATLSEMCETAQVSDALTKLDHSIPKPFELLPAKVPLSEVQRDVSRLCNVDEKQVEDIYPCTPMQEGLIALSSKRPGAYVAQTVYRLSSVNVDRFKVAWQAVVAEENILRTRIVFTESLGFLQSVVNVPVSWTELESLDDKYDTRKFQESYSGGGLTDVAILRDSDEKFQFVLTIHHALYDRWSIPLILQKVRAFYDRGSTVVSSTKAAVYPQFIRFILNDNKAESTNFWQQRLAGTTSPQFPALPKPTYQPNPTGRLLRFMSMSRKRGAEITTPMLIRAAWGLTISAYSNSEDVMFGEIFSGRDTPIPGITDMTGPAFATVPIRIQAKRDLNVGHYLKRFQEEFTEALPYQHMGLLKIKRIDDDTNNATEFQNLISINNEVPDTADFFQIEEAAGSGAAFFTYGLTVAFDVHAADIEMDAHFDPECISEWQVERLIKYFECALTQLNAPETASSQLDQMRMLLAEDEAVIRKWNSVSPTYVGTCVHEIVRNNAESLPRSNPAVCAWDAQLTYRELDAVATSFANYLRQIGVSHGSYVPICFEKSALTIIAMLAIMKVGAAFVPIDGAAPKARLQGIAQDADATHVLCSPKYKELCDSLGAKAIVVDQKAVFECPKDLRSLPAVKSDDIAYIIFTSGSTGKPKGTLVSHSAFSSGALAHGAAMGMQATSRVLQFASYTFDASVMEILSTLLVGGCVCVPDEKTRLDDVAKAINDLGVNWALLTPSFAKLLSPATVPGLKTLALGGEAMSQSDVLTWAGNTRLVNAYGPSEAAVVATVQPHVTIDSKFSSIGKAVGSRCFIVNKDDHEELVPVGAAGELVIHGPILASGYLKEKAKTEAAFVATPKWMEKFQLPETQAYQKIYKTGDLVRYSEDGSLLYSGRKDNQTKLNGQRLELGEIEHHLRQDHSVKHALALIPKAGHFNKRLVAVISLTEDLPTSISHEELDVVVQKDSSTYVQRVRDYLRNQLQPFMVPSNWVTLQIIPMMPSGKLDRRKITTFLETLPDEVLNKISGDEGQVVDGSGNEIEKKLQQIWAKALDLPVEKTGMDKNFLFLGGDSISALQVLSQCRAEGISVTVQDIIRSTSIRQLASNVSVAQTVSFGNEQYDRPFSLSPMQRLYFEWVGNHGHHFNQSSVMRLSRKMGLEEVSTAIIELVKLHSMLRASFEKDRSGQWAQKVDKEPMKSYRINHHPGKTTAAQIGSSVEITQRSLNIQKGPIFAVDLFESDESGSQVLALVAHHLVIDIVSWNIIQEDLQDLLTFRKAKSPASLPFQIWNGLQEKRAQDEATSGLSFDHEVPLADLSYWGMADAANLYGEVKTLELEVEAKTTESLLGPCNRALDTELIDVLLGSILLSFSRTFSDRRVPPAVFNEAHGREQWDSSIDISHTIGWFTTISPVFLPSEAGKDNDIVSTLRWVRDIRSRTSEKGRQYFAHRMLTGKGRADFAAHWPMEIAFNYSGQQKKGRHDSGALLQTMDELSSRSDVGPEIPRFALFEISAGVVDNALQMSLTFPRKIRRQHSIQLWMTGLKKMLQRASQELLKVKSDAAQYNFPLLPLTYKGTEKLEERVRSVGVASLANIEDVYASSPMQQGVLLSQVKNPGQYMYQNIFVARFANSATLIDSKKLARAWRMVVQTHPSLRTVFIESLSKEGLMDQAVVKSIEPNVVSLQSHAANAIETLKKQEPINFFGPQPHHRFTTCETTSRKVFCKIELSHAVCDGTSVAIILQDLARFYNTTTDEVVPAPTNRDFISCISKTSYDSNLTYWRRYLQNAEPCSFPTLLDSVSPKREHRSCELKLEDLTELHSFCAQRGVTLSNLLQLVWAVVLRVYTGNDNVCFGYISAGRDVPVEGIQNAVGLFISMLVCRIDLSSEMAVRKALGQVQNDYIQSTTHQAFSLSDIQHELGSGVALFNTVFTFQRRFNAIKPEGDELLCDVLHAYDPGEYPLTVNVEALEAGIDVSFNYWTDFLCDTQATNISETFEQILLSMLTTQNKQQTIGAIETCSESHQQQIFDWNDRPLPKVDKCVHDVIYQQSQTLPLTAPAICSWDMNLTYVKLMSLSKRLAKHLVSLGVGPEKYIPLCFEKSTWAVVAMLGVLQAGGAFVPLEPSHPDSRIKYIIDNVGAKIVLCSARYREKFADIPDLSTFVVDESFQRLPLPPSAGATKSLTPANAAYLIFTSGTTGNPKGTIIAHHAFATGATEHAPAILMRQKSRVLQFSNLCFDASVMEILTTLMTGACICIPSDEERMNNIIGAINRMSVTWTLLTPSVAKMLTPESVPTLEVLVTGGEAMQTKHIEKWRNSTALVNAYGPSECAVIATTSTKVDLGGSLLDEDPANIGRGIGGRAWVVNPQDHNQLMPIGSVGELVVEGNTVARAYLNNEEKTSKAFVPRPAWMSYDEEDVASGHSTLIYKTGDLVRYNALGEILYVARKDTQIKMNGLRIELGDIEYHVKQHLPERVEAAVEMVAPAGQGNAIAAFLYHPDAAKQQTSDEDALLLPMSEKATSLGKALKSKLSGSLPSYMVPSLFVPVSRMPWTASGKLDRPLLKKIVKTMAHSDSVPYRLAAAAGKKEKTQEVATEMEKTLQRLWASILNVKADSIGGDDNFFAIGGDSVTGMRLGAAARAEKISLSSLDIFRKPTLAEMATTCTVIEEEKQKTLKPFSLLWEVESLELLLDEIVGQCQIQKDQIADAYPCSPLQEGLITLSTKQSGAYVAHNVFRLPQSINLDHFKAAWQTAFEEMDILRTRVLHTSNDTFVQAVISNEQIQWRYPDSTEEASSVQLPESNGTPLVQFALVTDSKSQDHFFIFSTHHAVYDGWSMPRMLQRVEDIYSQGSLQPFQAPYAHYIDYILQSDKQTWEQFWSSKFEDLQTAHFPSVSASESEEVEMKTFSHVVEMPHKPKMPGITYPTIVRAAWAIMLSALTGSEDVVYGETMTGRDIPIEGIMDMLGPTFTTVAARYQTRPEATVADFLQEVYQSTAEMIPHQHIGLQNIRRINHETALASEFRNLLVIQTSEDEVDSSKLWDPVDNGISSKFFNYPLVLECDTSESSIRLAAHYNEFILSETEVQRIMKQFGSVLLQVCSTTPESLQKVGEVEVISDADITAIREVNKYLPQTVEQTVQALFLQQVDSTPHSQAVCAWNGNLTYVELKEMAERLSGHLRSLGVTTEVYVPFCMEKSSLAIVAQLAILMAGGAIVPLDPAHPLSRHTDIIQDTEAKILLCSPEYKERYEGSVERLMVIEELALDSLKTNLSPAVEDTTTTSKNAAYVIFTSGSTGRPKGVVIEHEAFCSGSDAYCKAQMMSSKSRVLNYASYTFDVAMMEILSPLTLGACICIPNSDDLKFDLSAAIKNYEVTWTFLTPSVAKLVDPALTPSLKVLVCGGEPMTMDNAEQWAGEVRLINGYGPTEAAVITVTNSRVSEFMNPKTIGFGHDNVRTWLTDPNNPNRLAPVGSIGPCLARGYLADEDKTAAAFIETPAWSQRFENGPERLYRTGDLVSYNDDMSIEYIGRRDNQVKLNGQRLELEEIDAKLKIQEGLQHGVTFLPKVGRCKGRIVAVISLSSITSAAKATAASKCLLLEDAQKLKTARQQRKEIQESLVEELPSYMCPTIWVIMQEVPIMVSGKIDKKRVEKYIHEIDQRAYNIVMTEEETSFGPVEVTETVRQLREIWGAVFNIPVDEVSLSRSFIDLGGDSLTSMSIIMRCRKAGISMSVQNVLQSKSLIQLGKLVDSDRNPTAAGNIPNMEEKVDEAFDLSPIQQLYLQMQGPDSSHAGSQRFNQSQLVKISRNISATTVRKAIETLVQQHSMFRARYIKNDKGRWQQKISPQVLESYRFLEHELDDIQPIAKAIANSQACMNVETGPLLAVDLMDTPTEGQILSLVAHHMVVDVVSWNVILQQLEALLSFDVQTIEKPLSFQVWLALQKSHATANIPDQTQEALPFEINPADESFWGMADRPNVYGETKIESFELDKMTTDLILTKSNKAMATQPIEILLCGLIYSFRRVFPNRSVPTVFNESYGRETWDSSIDLSGTVGWFTSLAPILLPSEIENDNLMDTLKEAKDLKRSVPLNGLEYMARRFYAADPKDRFDGHSPMEIMFNYFGRGQQQGGEQDKALLQPFDFQPVGIDEQALGDVGPRTARLALFEVSAAMTDDQLKMTFMYNKHMKRQEGIKHWIIKCQQVLMDLAEHLLDHAPEPTLSDYPLLPTTYKGLTRLTKDTFPKAGIPSIGEVEEMMVCAPTQDGLLLSQIRSPDSYHSYIISEIKMGKDIPFDVQRLVDAWQKVVDHHQLLRAVFTYSACKGHAFDQVVLKHVDGSAKVVHCEEEAYETELAKISLRNENKSRVPKSPHQMTICTTSSGKAYAKLELNHAVLDGLSVGIMMRDLALAYEDNLEEYRPLYSEYIKYIMGRPLSVSAKYWKESLSGLQSCLLPALNGEAPETRRLNAVYLDFSQFPELQSFCKSNELTFSNVMLGAWGLVLRQYTHQDDVCFGNLSAGRDAPIEGIQDAVGAFINMLVCRVKFGSSTPLKDVFRKIQDDFLNSLPHQHCPLAKIQHDLDFAGKPMFNTACSLQNQKIAGEEEETENTIAFEQVSGHDPTEFEITVNIHTAAGYEGACIKHWTSHVSVAEAEMLTGAYADILEAILHHPHQTVAEFDQEHKNMASKLIPAPSNSIKKKEKQKVKTPQVNEVRVKEIEASDEPMAESASGPSQVIQPTLPALPPIQPIMQPEMYRSLVKDCVQEVLEQLFKNGDLVRYKPDAAQMTSMVTDKVEKLTSPKEIEPPAPSKAIEPVSAASQAVYKTLRSLWSTLLQMPEGKIHNGDSFLALGGDSILAMELARTAHNGGLDLTVADVFTKPIFSDMADYVTAVAEQKAQQTQDQPVIDDADAKDMEQQARFSYFGAANVEAFIQDYICPKIGVFRGGIVDVLPVTDFQALSVMGTLIEPRWMLNYMFFDGQGFLDLTLLRRSAYKVVQNFDILRTVFVHCGDRFLQVVLRNLRPQFHVYDTNDDFDEFTRNLRDTGRDSFPRLGEPFIQFNVLRNITTMNHRIIIRISHAQYDGMCLPKIIDALKAGYEGQEIFPAPSFAQYAIQAAGPTSRDHFDYWRTLLRGSSMTSIIDRQQPQYDLSDVSTTVLKKEIKLPALNSKNVTPSTVFKAAWALTLAQLSGRSDICFGNLISGRNASVPDVSDVVGPCVNIVPVRFKLESKSTALDLLRRVQAQQVAGMSHEILGFREIIQQCTDWPEWTYFSSIVQHQNISQDMPLRLDRTKYKIGFLGSGENLSDFTIVSTPKDSEGTVEVALGFIEDGHIPTEFAQKALDMLCSFALNLARSPNSTLPSFLNEPNRKPVPTIPSSLPTASTTTTATATTADQDPEPERPSLAATLSGLKKREVYDIADTLRRAWRIVLPKGKQSLTSSSEFNLDTSFYDLGGDLISLACLSAFLVDEGYNIRLECLVERATMGEQIALLSLRRGRGSLERMGAGAGRRAQGVGVGIESTSTLADGQGQGLQRGGTRTGTGSDGQRNGVGGGIGGRGGREQKKAGEKEKKARYGVGVGGLVKRMGILRVKGVRV